MTASRTISNASPFAFAFAAHKTVAERVAAGQAFAGNVAQAKGALASVALNLAVFIAAQTPSLSPLAVAEQARDTLANGRPDVVTLMGQYKSMLQNAVAALRARPDFPSWDAAISEVSRLRMVDRFCKGMSLRALSDGVTSLRSEKAATTRDAKAETAKAAEVTAREAVGATGDTVTGLSVVTLMATVGKWQVAALAGDANARAVLAALVADVMATRATWQAADDAAARPDQLQIAA